MILYMRLMQAHSCKSKLLYSACLYTYSKSGQTNHVQKLVLAQSCVLRRQHSTFAAMATVVALLMVMLIVMLIVEFTEDLISDTHTKLLQKSWHTS
jgi:hypothetical protein